MSTHETIQIVHLSLLSIYLNHKYIQCKRKLLYVHLNRYVGWIISADCWCAINFRVYHRRPGASSPRAPPPSLKEEKRKRRKNWKGLTAFSVISALFKTVKLTYSKSDQFQLRLAPPKNNPPTPRAQLFSPLDGKFRGVGTLELSNPPGWGRKKKANRQQSVSSATFFIVCTVE